MTTARRSTETGTPEEALLCAALRELRARTGLSLAGLAQRTVYSKSSWQRYLGGAALPPRDAVEELCRLAGEPPARCLALWELAEPAWSGRSGLPPPGTDPAGDATGKRGTRARSAPEEAGNPETSREGAACGTGGAGGAPGPRRPGAVMKAAGLFRGAAKGPGSGPFRGARAAVSRRAAGDGAPRGAPGAASSPGAPNPGATRTADGAPAPSASGAERAVDAASGRGPRSFRGPALLAGLAAVASAVVAVLLWPGGEPAPPAVPETSCSGQSCAGKSATATRCGRHPDSVGTYRPREGMQLDLRFEELCGAGWARVFGQRTGDTFEVSVPGRPARRLRIADKYEAEGRISTPMVPTGDPRRLRVCFTPANDGTRTCFGPGRG